MKVKKNVEPWRLAYVKDGPRSLPSEFGQNHVSNSWDIPDGDMSPGQMWPRQMSP